MPARFVGVILLFRPGSHKFLWICHRNGSTKRVGKQKKGKARRLSLFHFLSAGVLSLKKFQRFGFDHITVCGNGRIAVDVLRNLCNHTFLEA
jgi:hypothetical protein